MSSIVHNADFYKNPPNHVIVQRNGTVLTSPIEPYDPPLVHDDLEADPDFLLSTDPFLFRTNLSKYPQFAFIPRSPRFVGPLLGRLAQYKVVQHSDGRYGLEANLLKSWIWLEDTLAAAISSLSSGFLLPMVVDYYPYPRKLGYRRAFKGARRAARSMQLSREAFVVTIGLFSMFYSFHAERHFRSTVIPQPKPYPSVRCMLKNTLSLADSIVQDLIDMESALGMRIGVIVNTHTCEWFRTFHFALAYAGVRFWLVWDKAHPMLVSRIKATLPVELHRYLPDHELLRRCVQFMEQQDWPSVTSEQLLMMDRREVGADDDVLDQSLEPAPPPSPPKDRSVETPLDFIKRRVEQEGARREKASPEELLRWSHRQRHADRNRWTAKSKVYHWTKVAGTRTRTRVEKNQIEHAWDKTEDMEDRTDNQRKYSAVFDEWDICTEFDKSESQTEPEDDLNLQSNLGLALRQPSTNPSQPLTSHAHAPLPPPPTLNSDHNAQGIVLAHASGIDDEEVNVPQLDVLLYSRYGFILEALGAAIREGAVSPVVDPLSLDAVARVLMEKNAVSSTSCQDAACQAVTLIKRGLPIPDQYWDVKNDELRQRNPYYFTFLPLELNSVDSNSALKGYAVNPTSSRYLRPWMVLFESSIAVTQCIRERWGPSLEDVISKACQTGFRIRLFLVKFKTDLPLRSYPIPTYSRREREGGFVPSHFDFHAYQQTVQSLLEMPRLRVAVLRGGILARICSPYVNLDDVAAYGPSNDAIRYGSRWRGEDDNVVFVEDYISDAEIELLCGYYHIDTSAESGRAGQSRTVSFFPTPDVWEASGVHTLAWSNSAEEKFRTLMAKLRPSVDPTNPVPSPVPVKGKKEWRQNLRHHIRETKGFLGYVEQASSEFLTSLLL